MKRALCLFLLLGVFGCDSALEDLNVDPNNPVTADVPLVLTAAEDNILSQFSKTEISYDYMSGPFIRAFAGRFSFHDQWEEITNRDSDWDAHYNGLLDAKDVIVRGTEQELWQHVGVAKILTALTLGYLTDIYGAIPYSEALQGPAVPAPHFDTQESLYNTIFSLLEAGITDLERPTNFALGEEDFIYNGNVQRWKAAGYLLLARYHNHLSVRQPAASATRVLEVVDQAKAAGLTSSDGDLAYPYEIAGRINPWAGFYKESPWILASFDFMNLMLTTADPRTENYWTKAVNDGVYRGKENSSPTTGDLTGAYSRLGGFFGEEDSPMPVATYAEFRFIEAEAAWRSGDAARAAAAYNAGIVASIDKVTPWYRSRLSGDDLVQYQQKIDDYKQTYAQETATSLSLEKIMTQKYSALFPMNVESWVDVRRHEYQYPGYQKIPTDDAGNPVAITFVWRGIYPQSELSKNPNTPSSTLHQKLWWNE